MGKPDAPKPPDPKATSAASTATNVGTAIANANLGNVNQVTPDGSVKYDQTDTYTWNDPYTGKSYQIPRYTMTQELSPAQQAIKDQNDGAGLNLSTLGNKLSGSLGEQLTGNFKLGNEAVEGRLMELGMNRLQPQLDARRASTETDLINRGIRPGSDNYKQAQEISDQGENDAFNQLLLTGRGQASQELLTEDNQRINQISALMSGGQVSQPNFMNANMPTIPTTDTAGIIGQNYDQKMAAYQQKMAQQQNLMGGLFGAGAAIISDRRMKTEINEVGRTKDGQKIYSYRYKTGGPIHIGLMADEVEQKNPDAVMTLPSGVQAVNYEKALEGV